MQAIAQKFFAKPPQPLNIKLLEPEKKYRPQQKLNKAVSVAQMGLVTTKAASGKSLNQNPTPGRDGAHV